MAFESNTPITSIEQVPASIMHAQRQAIEIEQYSQRTPKALNVVMPPSPIIPMLFVTEGHLLINGNRVTESFVAGIWTKPLTVTIPPDCTCIQVNLDPTIARSLLQIDLSEIADLTVPLHDVLGSSIAALDNHLRDGCNGNPAQALVQTYLQRRLETTARNPAVATAVDLISRRNGDVRISEVAHMAGCSRKHLIHLFQREVGVNPKTFARIIRFELAANLATRSRPNFASLAARLGYADQSHFNRECFAFTGMAPGEFFAAR